MYSISFISIERPADRDLVWTERNGDYIEGFTKRPEFENLHKELIEYLKIPKGLYR